MKILLTGGTGFIGGNFLRLALEKGHDVAALLSPSRSAPEIGEFGGQLQWMKGRLDSAPWDQIQRFEPEVCIHSAWIATPGKYLEAAENHQLVEASLEFAKLSHECGVRHFVVLGTCIEYAPSEAKLSELTSPIRPLTTYARCKNQLHLELKKATETWGSGLSWARVFYPYGPGEHPARLCSSIIRQLRQGEKVMLKTPNSVKDYIHVEDLARALLLAVETKYEGALNVGTGVSTSVGQIAGILGEFLGRPELIETSNPAAHDPSGDVVADATILRSLGWQPLHSMNSGLMTMIAKK